MAVYDFFWKVWLRLNLLTKDVDNDYTAEVSTMKNTFRNEDIAKSIIAEGSEIKYDTLLSIINQHDRIIREKVQQGYSVLTGCCQFTPRVQGTWIGDTDKFDPARHKVTLDITLAAEMREALKKVGVEVLEVKESTGKIGLVIDTLTGGNDGTITAGDDIRIEGEKIKVMGESEEIGVYFFGSDGEPHKVTRRFTQNDPKCVIARVPQLPDGTYTLRIVTQYSQGSVLLKEPRTIEYKRPLTIGNGGGTGGDDDDRPVIE